MKPFFFSQHRQTGRLVRWARLALLLDLTLAGGKAAEARAMPVRISNAPNT